MSEPIDEQSAADMEELIAHVHQAMTRMADRLMAEQGHSSHVVVLALVAAAVRHARAEAAPAVVAGMVRNMLVALDLDAAADEPSWPFIMSPGGHA